MANLNVINPSISAQFTYESEFNYDGTYKVADSTKTVTELSAQVLQNGNYAGNINVNMVGDKRKLNIYDVESENIAVVAEEAAELIDAIEAQYTPVNE